MSLFGALFAGVSGLNANAHAMGIISDNIANVNTVGYKVTNARFSTLVTESATATRYSPGGVISKPLADFNRQGLMQASSSATDIGITGSGLFVVNELASPSASSGQYLFTRAGSFAPDKNGDLRNAAGLYLQGWVVDAAGNIPANRSDLTALSTVNVSGLTGTAEATTTMALKANLQSSQALTLTGPQDTTSAFGITSTAKLSDGVGGGTIAGLLDADSFSISDGTTTYGTFVYRNTPAAGEFSTLAELQALIDAKTELSATIGGSAADATLTVTGLDQGKNLVITNVTNGAGTDLFGGASPITTAQTYDATASAKNMASGTVKTDFQRSVGIFDSKGGARTVTFSFLKSGTANQWYTEVHVQPATDATVTSPLVNGQIATGIVAFNNDGTLNASATTIPASLTVAWAPILGLQNSTIALNLGTTGKSDGMTQFDAPSNLVSSDVNGALFGTLTGVTIGEDGFVTAQFNNGTQRNIFKVAVATFPNPAGLANKTGNAFVPTARAGDFNLLEPGLGGSGSIVSSALEASTVDIAQEFTNMIVTQRAYSASSRIITTSNDMLDELIRIIR
jgi:flagellar hook protein FlgE